MNIDQLRLAAVSLTLLVAAAGCGKDGSEQSSAIPSGVPGQAMQGMGGTGTSTDASAGQSGGSTSTTHGAAMGGTGNAGSGITNAPGMAVEPNGTAGSTTQSTTQAP